VVPYTDYLIGNETEALTYAESHGWGITDITEIAKKLATLPKKNAQRPRVAIVTQGTLPTVTAVAKADGSVEVKEYPVHEIAKEKINDTTGAGCVPLFPLFDVYVKTQLLTSISAVTHSPEASPPVSCRARPSTRVSTLANGSPASASKNWVLRMSFLFCLSISSR
jgi:hypothetical protein